MEIVRTTDGSQTLFSEEYQQHYHSVFGAETESNRVYIELGFFEAAKKFDEVNLLEVGFGTGLNAFLSFEQSKKISKKINYFGVEAQPIQIQIMDHFSSKIRKLHVLEWGLKHQLSDSFSFTKIQSKIQDFQSNEKYNLIYFDAFAPESQPELWTTDLFQKLYDFLMPNGILTTYCSKVLVQRNLKQVGFKIEKHKGPPHKREVLRAIK